MGIKLYKWKLWKAETQHVPVESKRPSPNRDFSNSDNSAGETAGPEAQAEFPPGIQVFCTEL